MHPAIIEGEEEQSGETSIHRPIYIACRRIPWPRRTGTRHTADGDVSIDLNRIGPPGAPQRSGGSLAARLQRTERCHQPEDIRKRPWK